ncbi:zinc-dependent metalloprotease family protein [Lutimonas halocynthiae]|uniref:T9SS type A sorting domain-containing protein n=1 Tax=Lutimonas halocynthiae TaxID=1446477 RepID=UPI0025B44F83|nr:zinc-dependent metalloprotease family protein [Lutimonas halocynthiae]MDN3642646.1 zinc-dependent metalloprotease family protein [Lutimonas halocynthiae]
MTRNQIRFFAILFIFFTNFMVAQQRNLWTRIDDSGIKKEDLKRKANVDKHKAYRLDLERLERNLLDAPKKEATIGKSNKKVVFPDGRGGMITYLVKEASVMHPDLAKKYPKNKSYVGVSEKNGSKRIRFSINELGLNAVIRDVNQNVQYIEPLTRDKKNYKLFYRDDLSGEGKFQCFTEQESEFQKALQGLKITDDGKLRTYRLALATTGEYSQFHIADQNAEDKTDEEKTAIVLSAVTTALTQVNAIYETDLAVTMQLVADNDELIYLNPDTDPYTNLTGSLLLDENQSNLDNVIEEDNYDIGHVFSTGGGGVASLSVVCRNGSKARGTTGLPEPIGDYFYYDYVAHEMGHQFGANHSFNGDDGNCAGDNRNDQTAVEPGSGSSLMSYAGLCESQNVQSSVDPYFHIISIEEIRGYITNGQGGSCPVESNLIFNANAPDVDAGEDFTIPIGTPYRLTATATDADGDQLSFSWEQVDNQITTVPPSGTSTSGALYKSHKPSLDPVRYLPKLTTLATGVISSTWEVTPLVEREMNFILSVRDNHAEAGQVSTDDLKVNVTASAGPFLVTSQATEDLIWTQGEQETITWDVAGTDGNGLNVSQVNILLSTDWGKTYATVLASNIPNNGSQTITVPEIKGSQCFVMVEAIGNHFFAINSKSFSIGEFNVICNEYESNDTPIAIPDDDREGISSVIVVPEDINVESLKVSLIKKGTPESGGEDEPGITHTYLGDLSITLESPEGTIIELISNACGPREDMQVVLSDNGDQIDCNLSNPGLTGIRRPVDELAIFSGENAQGNWILNVVDGAPDDTGNIEAWSLEICSSEAVLGVNNYVFDNFTVFPNPSDGLFTIKFESEETGDVDVMIYDLLGRTVAKKTYKTISSRFEQALDLQGVSGGIYMLSVKRGNKVSAHKIRIK